jgi:rsbT antagonist protein RsbS
MAVPILRQGPYLIATVMAAIEDHDWQRLGADLVSLTGGDRAKGVLLDVTNLDVLDSFAARTLATIAQTIRLRGAMTVLVGIQPEVAFAMVQLGLAGRLAGIATALDLVDGMATLDRSVHGAWRHG